MLDDVRIHCMANDRDVNLDRNAHFEIATCTTHVLPCTGQ